MTALRPIVYVIDDTESVRKSIESLIRSVGLEARVFASPREFLQSDTPDVPSCLILDIRLPGMSGLELQRELSETNTHIPIIFVTGHGDVQMSVRAMKAGAIEFLTKPFRDQDLLDAIQVGLESDRVRRSRIRGMHIEQSPLRNETQGIRLRSDTQVDGNALRNELLLHLPSDECRLVFPLLTFLLLRAQDVLSEIGEPIKYGYFINDGLVSMLNVMEDGRSVEVGSLGHESFVGLPLLVGFESGGSRAIVQIDGSGFRIAATALTDLLPNCRTLASRLQRYVQLLGLQSAHVAACNSAHQVEQRLARWLLMCQDRIGSILVPMTQESLAHVLGANRSSVSMAAGILQKSGLIAYTPGHVTILNRTGLESAACECYGAMVQQAARWNKESA